MPIHRMNLLAGSVPRSQLKLAKLAVREKHAATKGDRTAARARGWERTANIVSHSRQSELPSIRANT